MIKNIENLKKRIQSVVDIYKSGDLLKAETFCEKLIEINPKVAFLYNLLGLILVGQEKIELAKESYEKGIKIDPNFAMIYNNLGLLFFHKKPDLEKAKSYYKKAILINPKIPEPHNNLGSLYNSLHKFNDAIECYKKALKINPKFAHSHHNLGNVYISTGNFNEAKKSFYEAIKFDPNSTNSHRTLSRLIKYTKEETHFIELKSIYRNTKGNDDEAKMNIAFALGKAYEDIKDFEKSFSFYNKANTLYRKKVQFSLEEEIKKFKEIKNTFDKKIFNKYEDLGYKDSSPIFIVGMPRSGTTLVEQILSSHSKVFGADEIDFIPKLISENFGSNKLSLYFNKIVKFNTNDFLRIGKDYLQKMKNLSNNSERSTDKLPENFLSIGFIKLILPNSKIIHCYRNPKDNYLSLFKNHFPGGRINFSYNFSEIIEYYKLYKDLMLFWNKMLPEFTFNIKYENLVKNTENEIRNLLKFCNLSWEVDCLNFHKNKRAILTSSDIQARKKIYSSSIDTWKNYDKYLNEFF